MDSWEERGLAERLARGVRGVREVAPGKPIADGVLKTRIESVLASSPVLDASAIQVKVANGEVTLTGPVPTMFESAEAVDDVNAMEGVKRVSNQLIVVAPEVAFVWQPYVFRFGPYVDGWRYVAQEARQSDAAIARSIERELEWSPFVDARQVHVQVHQGKATLTGTVDSWRERGAALENAFEGGAIAVANQLKVG